jgi:hypothetical protein
MIIKLPILVSAVIKIKIKLLWEHRYILHLKYLIKKLKNLLIKLIYGALVSPYLKSILKYIRFAPINNLKGIKLENNCKKIYNN